MPSWPANLQGIYQYQPPICPLDPTGPQTPPAIPTPGPQTPPAIPTPLDEEGGGRADLPFRRGGKLEPAESDGDLTKTLDASQCFSLIIVVVNLF
ncbi:hypothetical protein DICSQDRAFT_168408 [Dichomitus squalens LYAD-421 SS1]|uniref:Uncharacterized protein n=1 Tax=Dichomitus squalens TaxID=114155 RepID=A0A4Q9Q447_9APHY|nr:uncharacterized protein DICSQDRAFT_168408 [Dichomitus squalens LYAD-421 SS1]EJF63523.1 hypothetical protein DICSQDRAFT_168408 [Dichomitus squalens LYAD-421 SS1]TBU61955.1 hypothetical protein BD310DRAFT_872908 [Dichomitus squalens]